MSFDLTYSHFEWREYNPELLQGIERVLRNKVNSLTIKLQVLRLKIVEILS